jgi:hypothetical protein
MTKYFLILGALIITAVAVLGCDGEPKHDLWINYADVQGGQSVFRWHMDSQEHCLAVRDKVSTARVQAFCLEVR